MAKYQKYAEYKGIKSLFIESIPMGWNIQPLYTLCEFQQGKAHEPFIDNDGDHICVNARFVSTQGGSFKYCNVNLTPAKLNDVLMVMSDLPNGRALARAFFVKEEKSYAVNQRVCAITAKKVNSKFLYYQLNRSPYFLMFDDGSNQTHLSNDTYKKYPVLLPSLNEQEKIANFLDHETAQIDTLIAKQEKLIELLKEKRQAVISHAVTKGLNPNVPMKDSGVEWLGEVPEDWQIIKLSQVALAFNGDRGANYPSGNDFVDEGIYFISANEIIDSKVLTETASKITPKKYEALGGLKIKKGDIIYCLRGAGVGKNGISDFDEGTVSSSLMGIRSTKLDPEYLVLLLNSSAELQQRSVLVNGSVSPNLSAENVMGYKFAIPSTDEQLEIKQAVALKVKALEDLLTKAESAIELMQERRTALISAAVTGKIDVRNWQHPNQKNNNNTELSA